jgi:hypothetical protein
MAVPGSMALRAGNNFGKISERLLITSQFVFIMRGDEGLRERLIRRLLDDKRFSEHKQIPRTP